ncbi:MAG: alpha/beta hydrolase [Clostridia bacterium]|nr:alpha/beta hydrolase [Clostridia bacterium]
MIYKVITSVMVDQLFKRQSPGSVKKHNRKFIENLEKTGRHALAETFLHAEETLDAALSEELTVKSFDGLSLYGRYYASAACSHITFVLLHGYKGGCARNFILQFDALKALGANILMIDQRAHRKSEGKYITFGAKERYDVEEWIKLLLSRDPETKVILYGISMGASTALITSGLPSVKGCLCGIIADCGFTSPAEEFRHLAVYKGKRAPEKFLETGFEVTKKKADFDVNAYSTEEFAKKLSVPALFVHGAGDTFVPSSFTLRNYEACASPWKKLLIVDKAGHGGSFYHDSERYTEELKELYAKASETARALSSGESL